MRVWQTLVLGLLLLTTAPAAWSQTAVVPQSREQITLSFAPLVREAAPAVVNIYTRRHVRPRTFGSLYDDPLFRRFFGVPDAGRSQVQTSLGSGVIVRSDGLIVTNHHVIEGMDEITVVLSDRRQFPAEIVTSDPRTDLALLRIDARGEKLPFLPLGRSDDLQVGDLVVAIGNPFGVGQTVTSGIVSALARTSVGVSDLDFFIQTDAAINPGNSGGALVAMDGTLVGINTAIYSRSGGSLGIGFAIPAEMVATVIEAAGNGGRLVRPWFGAEGQSVTADVAEALGMARPVGVILNRIHPGGPADRAGLRPGDVVLAVDGREVDNMQGLRYRIATAKVGSRLSLTVLRGGHTHEVAIEVQLPPDTPPRDTTVIEGRSVLAGATVANLSPALLEELQLPGIPRGVVIVSAAPGSPAARIGLQAGDRVLRLNDVRIGSVAELRQVLQQRASRWFLVIERDGRVMNLILG